MRDLFDRGMGTPEPADRLPSARVPKLGRVNKHGQKYFNRQRDQNQVSGSLRLSYAGEIDRSKPIVKSVNLDLLPSFAQNTREKERITMIEQCFRPERKRDQATLMKRTEAQALVLEPEEEPMKNMKSTFAIPQANQGDTQDDVLSDAGSMYSRHSRASRQSRHS